MKLLKIVLSIILAVCFMSSLVITYGLTAINAEETSAPEIIELCKEEIPATMDYETAFGKGHVKRMYDEESDLNTAVFLNGDGSRSLYLFYENIKYVDESGVVRDKSNALSESEGGYENEANDLKVRYGKSVTEGVKLSFDKYEIVMTPVEASQSAGPALPKSDEKSGEINGVTYANVFGEGTSVVYTQSLSGVKEDIVLEYDTGKRRFSFCVKTNGARLEQAADESGKIYVVDPETGKRISELSGITAWDSAGLYAKGKYTLGDGANENEYIVTIDASALLDLENIVYPVTIDPPILYGGGIEGYFADTAVFTGYSSAYGGNANLYVGNCGLANNGMSQYGTARSFVNIEGVLNTSTFVSTYDGYNYGAYSVKYSFFTENRGSNPGRINAYMSTAYWDEAASTYNSTLWNARGYYVGGVVVPSTANPARREIDITLAVNEWLNGADNNGIMLCADNETDQLIILGAREVLPDIYKPCVIINFTGTKHDLIYRIKNVGSGKYMQVDKGYGTSGMNIYQYTQDNSRYAQEFRLEYVADEGAYLIHQLCSMNGRRRVVDVMRHIVNGEKVLESGCNVETYKTTTSGLTQLFLITHLGNGQYKITLKNDSSLALTAYGTGNGTGNGTFDDSVGNIIVATYSGSSYQKWELERSETNVIENYYANMNLPYPMMEGDGTGTVQYKISSGFGWRKLDNNPERFHKGIDLPASNGKKLYSMFDGIVVVVAYDASERGNYIIVEAVHDYHNVYKSNQKLRFVYMHMREQANTNGNLISTNTVISEGIMVGRVSDTGHATGYHLHLGMIVDGSNGYDNNSFINPMMFYTDIDFNY